MQGSVLGPTLFNIYVSELGDKLKSSKVVSYADDSYVVVTANDEDGLKLALTSTLKTHFEWLESIGMKCNMSKTEIILFGGLSFDIELQGCFVKPLDTMKVLGITLDKDLSWEPFVTKLTNKVRSLIFSLRYVRKHLSLTDTIKIVKAQIISKMTYASPIWSISLGYRLREKLKSVYYLVLRTILRDFELKYNRRKMLSITKTEDIETIFFKRTSVFIYNIIYNLAPTNLTMIFLSKSYYNERHPNQIFFFDTSRSRVGKKCITNMLNNYTTKWKFEWFGLDLLNFKRELNSQFNPFG